MNNATPQVNFGRRAEDNPANVFAHIKKTFAEKFVWAVFLAIAGMIASNFWVLLELRSTTQTLTTNYKELESRIEKITLVQAEMRGQMVGWDVLKRMELMFTTMANQGKGNQAMATFGQVIRNEISARESNK